jgi:hypothetical protein
MKRIMHTNVNVRTSRKKHTFSGAIQCFNSLIAFLHEFFNIEIYNTITEDRYIIFNVIVYISTVWLQLHFDL